MTSTEAVRYTANLMERIRTSTVPTSDTAATATVIDGFTTAQSDHMGGSWSYTRQFLSTGILSTSTDPRSITSSTQTDIAGRTIIQTDGEGNETTTTYTSCCDQPASITDALGNIINYSYENAACVRGYSHLPKRLKGQSITSRRGRRRQIRIAECKVKHANIYYQAVSQGGDSPFNDAQENACTWKKCKY